MNQARRQNQKAKRRENPIQRANHTQRERAHHTQRERAHQRLRVSQRVRVKMALTQKHTTITPLQRQKLKEKGKQSRKPHPTIEVFPQM